MAESSQQKSTTRNTATRRRAARLDPAALVAAATGGDAGPSLVEESTTPPPPAAEDPAPPAAQDPALKAFFEANEAIVAGMATLGAEMVAFGGRRVHENLERSESLAECQSPEQAFQVQCRFFEAAAQQYLEQTNNVLAIMAAMTQQFWAPWQEQTRRSLQEIGDRHISE